MAEGPKLSKQVTDALADHTQCCNLYRGNTGYH